MATINDYVEAIQVLADAMLSLPVERRLRLILVANRLLDDLDAAAAAHGNRLNIEDRMSSCRSWFNSLARLDDGTGKTDREYAQIIAADVDRLTTSTTFGSGNLISAKSVPGSTVTTGGAG